MAPDYRGWFGNHLFTLGASKTDEDEMLDEEDFDLV
jgi:hypothetical protein